MLPTLLDVTSETANITRVSVSKANLYLDQLPVRRVRGYDYNFNEGLRTRTVAYLYNTMPPSWSETYGDITMAKTI